MRPRIRTHRQSRRTAVALVLVAFVLQRLLVPVHLHAADHLHAEAPAPSPVVSIGTSVCEEAAGEHHHDCDPDGEDHPHPHPIADHLDECVPTSLPPSLGSWLLLAPTFPVLERVAPAPLHRAPDRLTDPRPPPSPRRVGARAPPRRS